jgi:hypothetical protein
MADEPVAHLARHLGHQLTDTGEEDLGNAEAGEVGRRGAKNGVIRVCV